MTAGDDWIKRNGIFVVRDVDYTHVYPYGTDSPYGSTPNSFLHVNGLPNSVRYIHMIDEDGWHAFDWWSGRLYGLLLGLTNPGYTIFNHIY